MLKRLLLSFIIISGVVVKAQNLVPNFSFEQYSICPDLEDQIDRATGWSKYSETSSTPDYYNSCSPPPYFSVPEAGGGYQQAYNNGSAFAGIVTYATPTSNYREHFGIQLSQPLIIGQKYFISFYTVMSEQFTGTDYFGMPSNNIGIRLSTVSYNSISPAPIDNFAHLNYSVVLNDSINWTRVSGSIIADAAYNYLMVGNFFDDANTDTLNYNCGSCFNYYSYYYVDEICVSTDSASCNSTTTVPEMILQHPIIYPIPADNFINIKNHGEFEEKINIFNAIGQTYAVINNSNKRENLVIDCSSWPPGIYFLKTKNFTHKIIIQH
ncbi:MAG: hypothetical protein K0S44_891 [Bacteroidetes bacterium]|jgi:hypothetical protein|nr:hypothetical protein [Bacteroidota bacterium]